MKNSIYDYSGNECRAVKMPYTVGYAWYDMAMFDICKQLETELTTYSDLSDDPLYVKLKNINNYIMPIITENRQPTQTEKRYKSLRLLCDINLCEIDLKTSKYTIDSSPISELAYKYYQALKEYKKINTLALKSLDINQHPTLHKLLYINELAIRISKTIIKVHVTNNDIKFINIGLENALYEVEDSNLSKNSLSTANEYFELVKEYINTQQEKYKNNIKQ